MKKVLYLALLAVLPLGLVACDNSKEDTSEDPTIDTSIGEWVDADLAVFDELNKDIDLPYDTDLFKAYNTTYTDEDGSEKERIEANYSLYYDEDIHKIIFTLTSEDSSAAKQYYDFCVASKWKSGETNIPNGYKVVKNISGDLNYNIDIFNAKENEMYALAYTSINKSFNKTVEAFNYLNKNLFSFYAKEDRFLVLEGQGVSKISLTDGWLDGLRYVDLTFTTSRAQDLDDYKQSLLTAGYQVDKAYETKTQENYYIVSSFLDGTDPVLRAKDVMIDKAVSDNTFKMRLTLSEEEYL